MKVQIQIKYCVSIVFSPLSFLLPQRSGNIHKDIRADDF